MSKIESSKELFNNSFVSNYYDNYVINNQTSNILEINDAVEFQRIYGSDSHLRLEGFNRDNKNYIGPLATPHSVIHEILHNLSSSFNTSGKRLLNGIDEKDGSLLVNEGLTDYLACKISKEEPRTRDYITGVYFFRELDRIINEIYGNNNLLFEGYISNNTYFLKSFIDNFSTYQYKGTVLNYNNFIQLFGYLNKEQMIDMCKNIELNALKNMKKRILFKSKQKNIDFEKNNELFIVGLIRKAYYDIVYEYSNYNKEQIEIIMVDLLNNNTQNIPNTSGIKNLLDKAINKCSLLDVVKNNIDLFNDIDINSIIEKVDSKTY